MDFDHNDKVKDLLERLGAFMDEHVYPNRQTYKQQVAAMGDDWQPVPIIEALKPKAREAERP